MGIRFTKIQAYGNDYLFVDAIYQKIQNPGELSKRMSDRHFGAGSDGLVLVCPSDCCDFRMRIFNPDGTEAEMCGNALRGTAKYVYDYGFTDKTKLTIETTGGNQELTLFVKNGQVVTIAAAIGTPRLFSADVPVLTEKTQYLHEPLTVADRTFLASSLSWGNPHTVIEIEDVDSFDVEKYGSLIENLSVFPNRTNVTFAQAVDDSHIKIREWERGTGETLGCGTGCCSALVVFHLLKKCGRSVAVAQPGGVLHVEWREDGTVEMTGPSHVVYEGVFPDETEECIKINGL